MGNPIFTNLDLYYQDDAKWGDYQYSTLAQMVNNFMFEQEDDDYSAHADRSKVTIYGKKAVRELYFDIVNEVISVEFDLNPQLTIAIPHDYLNYVMISWVDERGKIRPMAIDKSNNLAQAYLQDNDFNFLYDQDGGILEGTHIQNTPETDALYANGDTNDTTSSNYGAKPFNVDRSKLHKNGSYRIDKEKGVIQFSSQADGRTIVLDYISDGLFQRDDSEIKIHKFAEEAVYSFIYFNLIKRKRNVPEREKARAEKEWWNYRRIAKRRINPVRYEEIKNTLKGGSRWIKD